MKNIEISVCIPTYEMHGKAKELLSRSFDVLKKQTFKDFEVIISDNSEDDVIENFCKNYQSLNIKYFKNPRKGISKNTNEAMKKAKGKLIKILYMDDYLINENSLQNIVDNFKGHWLVTGCAHDNGKGEIINKHYPSYNKKIYLGKNTIGSPSVLTMKNEDAILFDENLSWVLDCDYYKRLHDKHGEPDILNEVNVIIGVGKHQATSHLPYSTKLKERILMWQKYNFRKFYKLFKLW